MADFKFHVLKQDAKSRARLGVITTAHGKIDTPYFVPVGTAASVKSLDSRDLAELGAQCVLANTYHLLLQPGDTTVENMGGLHRFMNFHGPIFTDSGGFQALSLGPGIERGVGKVSSIFQSKSKPEKNQKSLAAIKENGITFHAPRGGSKHFLGPKESMEVQSRLGADIIMAFDECPAPDESREYIEKSMIRSHRWEQESLKYHNPNQALYGIVHGGVYKDLREKSADFVTNQLFDGIAIGGALGESDGQKGVSRVKEILDWVIPRLDQKKPRHLLGIGMIRDLFDGVERGVDTFDCVETTRIARHGTVYTSPESGGTIENKFRFDIGRSKFKEDKSPIDPHCKCYTCANYSRAYLNHLYRAGERTYAQGASSTSELTYFRLATIHNLHFVLDLMSQIRESIRNDGFQDLRNKWMN